MEISSDRPTPTVTASITPASGKPKRKTLSKVSKSPESVSPAAAPAPKKVTITSKPRKAAAPKAAAKPPTTPLTSTDSADIEIVSKQLMKTPIAEVSSDALRSMIATAAYYLAEQRHFAPGLELDDWLAAERQFLHASH
jgi:hypothetical protein